MFFLSQGNLHLASLLEKRICFSCAVHEANLLEKSGTIIHESIIFPALLDNLEKEPP